MTLISVASAKGSPGGTTSTLLLAGWWPSPPVVIEADPDGGVLAGRLGLSEQDLTLVSLAMAGRYEEPDQIWDHAQRFGAGEIGVIPAPVHSSAVGTALRSEGKSLGKWCAGLEVPVLADVGRLGAHSPALEFVAASDVLLMVCRPEASALMAAGVRLAGLAEQVPCGWLLVGDGPHSAAEVEDRYGVPVVARLPWDPNGARAVVSGGSRRMLRRSPLARQGRAAVEALSGWLESSRVDGSVEVGERVVANGSVAASGVAL